MQKLAAGSGSYKANNSGKLNVNYAEVTGDLYFFNKNENIHLTPPDQLSFEFEATTKNGSLMFQIRFRLSSNPKTFSPNAIFAVVWLGLTNSMSCLYRYGSP